ncbi:MAG: SDR family NAD(P)-dependent oxidoreductase [Candidatus Adiutrix sp.]|jgi:3-oxoacyl-(acyl-carrier-protein) synthase/acyl carrier protein/NAD(P)-dependent dehydrogenase (short-subunit alcohol dehydrogenase family)|nr:SDR family NAD(P)-dependent oxidoreductase [Candidatus Adiutrix sp.]
MTQDNSSPREITAEPVAIIGLSCLFPGSPDLAAYWALLKSGREAVGDIPEDHWSPSEYYDPDPKAEDKTYGRRGGFLEPVAFEPLKYGIVPNDLSAIDSTQLLGLVAADLALKDAGYSADNGWDHRRTAVMLGVTGAMKIVVSLGSRLAHPQLRRALADSGVAGSVAEEVLARFASEFAPWKENSFPGLLGNVTAGRIANRLNLGGANLVVDAACASSLAAVRQGLMELNSGRADLVLSGGLDTFSDPFMYTCFSKTPALAPSGEVRAYDRDGDGTMLGEGLGMLVLKRLNDARRDGDRVYAVIRGVGSSSDGKGAAVFAPSAEGQVRALKDAYEQAGFGAETVEMVEGHGTGTAVGDAVEVEALSQVFSQSPRAEIGRPWCALGSVKSQIGHTKAAAGAAGLLKAALALYFKTLPPAAKVRAPLPILTAPASPFHLSTRPRPWLSAGPRRAGVSAFGFGGSNFHCVLEEAGPEKAVAEGPFGLELLPVGADSPAGLVGRLNEFLADEPSSAARRARENFEPAAGCRLVLVSPVEHLPSLISESVRILDRPEVKEADFPEGAFFSSGPARASALGFLMSAPAELKPDQYRALVAERPELIAALSQAAAELAAAAPELAPLDLALYPPDLASPEKQAAWSADLGDGRLRKIAVSALQRGLTGLLGKFGLTASAVISGLESPASLAQELAKAANKNIDLWLELGPGRKLAQAASGAGRQALALDGDQGGSLDLACLLARLAAWGLPVDFQAWPENVLGAQADPAGTFTVMISGANYFVKKSLPPSKAKATPPEAPAGRSALDLLDSLSTETARLHQEFLRQQSDVLSLMSRELDRRTTSEAPVKLQGAPPAPAPAAPPAAPADSAAAETENLVLGVVAGETGYPVEMLKADMDLESDLGLDSIKKVEIMAVLSEKLAAGPGLEAESLSGARTLKDLIALARSGRPSPGPEATEASAAGPGLWPLLREVVAGETGYPPEMLDPRMRLGDDLGLDSIKLVEIAGSLSERLPGAGQVSAEVLSGARTLADLAAALELASAPADRPPAAWPEQPPRRPSADFSASEMVMEVLSRETGYPRDMLRPSMNLAADLGLDSIKKVEIMAALSERLEGLPALGAGEALAGLATIGDLAAFVNQAADRAPAAPERALVTVQPPGDLLLEVVAAETGYPQEMLRFESALEADLGLDSIKRVEIMAALSEKLGDDSLSAPAAEILSGAVTLGDLRDILLKSRAGRPKPTDSPAVGSGPVAQEVASVPAASIRPRRRGPGRPPKNSPPAFKAAEEEAPVVTRTSSVSAFKVQMKPWPWPETAPDGLGLDSGDRVLIVAEPGPVGQGLENLLRDGGQRPVRLGWSDFEEFDEPETLRGLILVWPGQLNDLDLPARAFRAVRGAGPALLKAAGQGERALLLGLTFMGGDFALAGSEAGLAPASAALTGLLKSAAREWPQVRVLALDLPPEAYGPVFELYRPGLAAACAAEGAPVEIGLGGPRELGAPALSPYKLKNIRVRHLREGQTVLVTGGARGVTAAALKEVARAYRPNLVILGRTPLAPAEPAWLAALKDEAAVRQALFDRAEVKPGPLELARDSRLLLAGREIRANIAAMEKVGAKVTYLSGNFENLDRLRTALSDVKDRHGPICGFIHGAGVLADSLLLDKKDADFDLVFNTKAQMAALILDELAGQPLSLIAFFSSSTARFGRRGQADYAAGNEVLNKLARACAGLRQGSKCLSVNWGPWAGGMVDGGLKRLFESEGVGLIPLAEGARFFAALTGAPKNDPVEVVVLGPATDLASL